MLTAVKAIKPKLPDAAVAFENIKRWAANHPGFATLLKSGAPAAQAMARWALELLMENQVHKGIEVLHSALALAPNDPILWADYGIALSQGDFSSEAAACLEYSVTLSRHQPNTWLMLGMVRKKLGDPGGAETAFRVALEQEPDSSLPWQLIGLLKQEQNHLAGAIECLESCIKAGGATAALFANLGNLYYHFGRITEACEVYIKAAALEPANAGYGLRARKTTFLLETLRGESVDNAIANYQDSSAANEVCSEKELMTLLQSAFSMLSGFGHAEAAKRVGQKQIELWPSNSSVMYLLSAVASDQTVDRSPPEYIVEHFDAFAEGFEAHVVGALGYDIPRQICLALSQIIAPGHLQETLDAGCGTGLCGPLLRPVSRVLTGVDLSRKMLDQAARKGVYDALECEELTAFLGRSPGRFDLIVGADLMIYFGELAPVFAAVATALKPDGLFAFSTELWTGEGYRLLPSGRFAHAPEYVRSAARPAFAEAYHAETTIRLEGAGRVPGSIFIFQRGRSNALRK